MIPESKGGQFSFFCIGLILLIMIILIILLNYFLRDVVVDKGINGKALGMFNIEVL